MSWGEAEDQVIESTCACGATFRIVAKYPQPAYGRWLEQHKGHASPATPNQSDGEGDTNGK